MIGLTKQRLCSLSLAALLTCVACASSVQAQGFDRVRLRNGVETGKITKMNALGLTITKSGVDKKLPVEEITLITYAGEPEDLAPARRDADAGRFANALEKLAKIERKQVDRAEIAQEIDFLTTSCQVQLALSGQGELDQARKQVAAFLAKNNKSYRVSAAIELLGNVLLAKQDFEAARAQFAKLGKAPAPYFKARSAILIGRALQAEGKHQAAIAEFDQALQAAAGNATAQSQELEATLLHAVSSAATGDLQASTAAVRQIIKQADVEDTNLLAQAYNALGDCYLQADDKKSARQAFLHVDLLFRSSPTEHAKALYELSQLWEDLGQSDRARDAQQRLKDQYPGTRWAKR